MGLNGRRVIEAMIAGQRDPHKLVPLTDRRLKATPKELYDALHGRLTDHHRFLLELHLRQYDALDEAVRIIDREAEARLSRLDQRIEPKPGFRDLIRLLVTIPGVSRLSALTVLSEIGRDMSRFATAGYLVAWAGLCPGQNESAGKRRRSRLRKGARWLKTMLVQCAWAAKRAKDSYYRAQFFRLQAKRGPQKAICAVAVRFATAVADSHATLATGRPLQLTRTGLSPARRRQLTGAQAIQENLIRAPYVRWIASSPRFSQ
jgi:transposase